MHLIAKQTKGSYSIAEFENERNVIYMNEMQGVCRHVTRFRWRCTDMSQIRGISAGSEKTRCVGEVVYTNHVLWGKVM